MTALNRILVLLWSLKSFGSKKPFFGFKRMKIQNCMLMAQTQIEYKKGIIFIVTEIIL